MLAADSDKWLKAQEVLSRINTPGRIPVSINLCAMTVETSAVYLSIDEVCVDKQKGVRKKNPDTEEGSYVWHVNVHLRWYEKCKGRLIPRTYVITAREREEALKIALAFLVENDLLMRDLIFLLDGSRELKEAVRNLFHWHRFKVILDWYHVKKKLGEYLSGSMMSNDLRKEVLRTLLRFLWAGDVDGAKTYIEGLPASDIRDSKKIEQVLGYLDRKSPDIACYAVRAALGLPNSSHDAEKTNDILVASRQKHDGTSWTDKGTSGPLATLKMLQCNGQLYDWLASRKFGLQVPRLSAMAA